MARERAGQDLRYVADMLRIRYAYLEAIEQSEYDKLPGAPYAIGFIRAYADHLDLNSVETVERFKQETANVEKQTQLVFPKPLPEGKVPSGGILLVGVVLAFLVYGGWLFLSSQDKPIAELIPEIPARFAELVGIDGDDGSDSATDDEAPMPADLAEEQGPLEMDGSDGETIEADDPVPTGRPLPEREPVPAPADSREASVDEPAAPVAEATAETVAEAEAAAEESLQSSDEEVATTEEETADTESPAAVEPETVMEAAVSAPPAETAEEPNGDSNGLTAAAAAQQALSEIQPEQGSADPDETPVATESEPAAEAVEDQAQAAEPGALVPSAAPEIVNQDVAAPDSIISVEPLPDDGDEPVETVDLSASQNGSSVEETEEADTTPTAPAAQVAAATPPPGERIYGQENVGYRILITARVDSWVEVSADNGELLLTRVLRAGDSFQVPDRLGLTLVTGNAGGLSISVDGEAVPDIGPVGAVRRGVPLDPDRLKDGTAGNT